jgi:hypothetical protein
MATGYKTGGRKKGTPNKITRDLRDMILGAVANAGGCDYLTDQAKTNPRAFLTLLGKLLPTQISYGEEDDDDPVEPVEEFSDLEIARRLAFLLARGNHALECSQEALLSSSPPVLPDSR